MPGTRPNKEPLPICSELLVPKLRRGYCFHSDEGINAAYSKVLSERLWPMVAPPARVSSGDVWPTSAVPRSPNSRLSGRRRDRCSRLHEPGANGEHTASYTKG
jgi:hypothetical protein